MWPNLPPNSVARSSPRRPEHRFRSMAVMCAWSSTGRGTLGMEVRRIATIALWVSQAALGLAAAAEAPIAGSGPPADLVLLHGRIHTQNPERSIVQALAVRDRLIVAVGTDREVSALAGPQTQIVDLKGRVVLPGMIDAHTHPAQSAQDLGKCNLNDQPTTATLLTKQVAECL